VTPAAARKALSDIRTSKERCPSAEDATALIAVGDTILRLEVELRAARAAIQWAETHAQKAKRLGSARACRKLVDQLVTSSELVEAMRSAS